MIFPGFQYFRKRDYISHNFDCYLSHTLALKRPKWYRSKLKQFRKNTRALNQQEASLQKQLSGKEGKPRRVGKSLQVWDVLLVWEEFILWTHIRWMNTKVYPFELVFSSLLEKENHFLHEALLQTLVWSDRSLNILLFLQILKHLRALCTPLTDPFELLCGCCRNTLSPSPGS